MRTVVTAFVVFTAALAAAPQSALLPEAPAASVATRSSILDAADDAWARRHEGRIGARASGRRISESVSGYEHAAQEGDAVEPRWKLARALFFQAKFTGLRRDFERALLERARDAGEEGVALLRRRAQAAGREVASSSEPRKVAAYLSGDPDAAATYFWTAVAWGEWGQIVPRVKAAKSGVATRVRDYSTTLIAIDPAFEDGGGYRILGRLHHRAPRIPLVTPWVSREEGIRNLRLAVATAPANFVNRHFLAEALADTGPAGRREAIRITRALISDEPSPAHLVEDLAIQDDARRDLLAWGARS